MRPLYPRLDVEASNKDLADFDPENTDLLDEETRNGEARDAWLVRVKEQDELREESGRLTWLLRLHEWLTTNRAAWPEDRDLLTIPKVPRHRSRRPQARIQRGIPSL